MVNTSLETFKQDLQQTAEQIEKERQEEQKKMEFAGMQQEIKQLNKEVQKWENLYDSAKRGRIWDTWLGAITLLIAVCLIGSCGYAIVTAPDSPTHCVIESDNHGWAYTLKGAIPWESDANYGTFRSIPEAIDAAERLGCTIKSQE